MNLAMLAEAMNVANVLGIPTAKRGASLSLAEAIEKGLPLAALERLAHAMAPNDSSFRQRLMPRATWDRQRKSAEPKLTSEEGNRLARLAKVWAFALQIYKDEEKARTFLNRPHMLLEGKKPLDVALATDPGADLVINILGRAAYGGAA